MIQRIYEGKVEVGGSEALDHHIYEGSISSEEAKAAKADPATFLKKAGIRIPRDGEIQFDSKQFRGGPANAARAGRGVTIRPGLLCRVTIVVIGRYVIISIRCIPIVVIDGNGPGCW